MKFVAIFASITGSCPPVAPFPKIVKILDEPQKTTGTSETKKKSGGSNGKLVAPSVLLICPIDKSCNQNIKKLGSKIAIPNIKILGSKMDIFGSSSP